jgi:hypothetical protein
MFTKGLKQVFALFFVLYIAVTVQSCKRGNVLLPGKSVWCSAEKISPDGKHFVSEKDPSILFDGAKCQTSKEAHSGKFSAITYPKRAFTFGFRHISGPDEYYKITVWRKSKSGNGLLVATTKDVKKFYKTAKIPVTVDSAGWEKLELEVFTPPFFDGISDYLQVYVWNNSKDTVYFDDIKIERFAKKDYPVYKEEPLSIILDTSQYLKLLSKRKEAFENGVLQSSGDDWVKGIIFGNGKMMKAKLRLKGDWLDHLYGTKWSFRIKLRKRNAWRRLRVFSIQTPAARDYLMEWASHLFYESKDILTTRYGFVPVLFNNQSRGIYAYEEHFVKQLVEWRQRREGPIVKFSEDAFWQQQKISLKYGKWVKYPFFEASVIEPFSESKTVKSQTLYNEFLEAQKLMFQFKNGIKKPSEIFDLEKLAKYYAILDLTLARHGMAWHNQRFYYNPVLCKLEPIAYDGYTDHSHENRGIKDNYLYMVYDNRNKQPIENMMIANLFKDSLFLSRYLIYLEKFSSASFVDSITNQINKKAYHYDSLIRLEFPFAEYDFDFFKKSAAKIREYLPRVKELSHKILNDTSICFKVKKYNYTDTTVYGKTPQFFVNAYIENRDKDSVTVKVENYFPKNIVLLGTGHKNKNIDTHFVKGIALNPFKAGTITGTTFRTDTNSNFLFFIVKDKLETFVVKIHPWPKPQGLTAQQYLMRHAGFDIPLISKVEGKEIYIKKGENRVDYNVVIPAGYKVHFDAGTKIDFVNKAIFLSYSPVIMNGEKDNPVIITSSDFSANGFTVLQPKGKSTLNHVVFNNMNTLNYNSWILTGAVTFYEADVSLNNVTFYRNQCEDALNLVRCNFSLSNSTFDFTHSDAFDSDFSRGTVEKTLFTNIGNDAIDFSGSKISVKNCIINGARDKGVSGGEDSHLVIDNCTVSNSNIGLASKDLSSLKVSNSKISDCNYGAVLLQKKPEYGPATMVLKKVSFYRPKTKWLIEKGSFILNDNNKIEGDKKDVAKLFY